MKNKYINRSHISENKFRLVLKCFTEDVCALDAAGIVRINRNTANRIYTLLRHRIVDLAALESPFSGMIEVDESLFGARRIKGKRGRGAYGKTTVFGILERQGRVYTEIVSDCSKQTLQAIIRGHVASDAVIHSDGWRGYNGLVDLGYGHFRVDHSKNEFARRNNHINGIESFWSYAKRRLAKFNGISNENMTIFLKETEYRFNHRNKNLYRFLLRELRQLPL